MQFTCLFFVLFVVVSFVLFVFEGWGLGLEVVIVIHTAIISTTITLCH